MKRVLPEADMRGYEHRIDGLVLPDPADRHVLAAAIEAGAGVILRFNLKDFPTEVPGTVRHCRPAPRRLPLRAPRL